jgi:hypothetical protein
LISRGILGKSDQPIQPHILNALNDINHPNELNNLYELMQLKRYWMILVFVLISFVPHPLSGISPLDTACNPCLMAFYMIKIRA